MEKQFEKLSLNSNSGDYQSPLRLRNRAISRKEAKNTSTTSVTTTPSFVNSSVNTTYDLNPTCSYSFHSSGVSKIVDYSSESESNEIEPNNLSYYDISDLDDSSEEICEEVVECEDGVEEEKVIVSKTTKSKPKLIFEDEEFILEKTYKGKMYWKCAYSKPQCRARIHTDLNYKPIAFPNPNHSIHLPRVENVMCKIVTNEIKEKATISSENPRKIVKECLTRLPVSAASNLTSINNLTQAVKRSRNKVKDYGKEPKTREQIVINDKYKKTNSDEDFVLLDSGEEDLDRIIILGTITNLKRLENEKTWYMDGTFSISPKVYKQLFTINIIKENKNLPLLYALLPDKLQTSYERVFEFVRRHIQNEPDFVITDFEKSILNCIEKFYPKTKIGRCYFHLTKNLWKNVVDKGLKKMYRKNESFRQSFRFLKALPFVPIKHTIFAFDYIKSISPSEFTPILDYFESNYIGKKKEDDEKVRLVPRFKIDTWNVRKRMEKNLPRSNNSVEAWHKAMSQDIPDHPNVNKLIDFLLKEQHLTEILIQQIKSGMIFQRDKSEVKRDNCLIDLFKTYKQEYLHDFFLKISKIMDD
ncbi:unnamed protein product [Brachionus calyciflorus]|uniref:MULE transposase domain-containing protein n=1 Tax=Brachionus calyciflorus TaxID=104777 RepID=A0A814QTY2_9BILA|nr:unnamed protein product [Brachionus calyciflorus]